MQNESILIIAGEMSGEEIALGFMDKLLQNHPQSRFFGVGGDALKERGVELLYHLKDFSSWGISGVLSKIPFYFKALDHIGNETQRRDVKIAILIDFQTFNFKLAEKLHKQGVKVLFLVAPQAWVWKSWRGKQMSKWTEALFCLLPFEKKWFSDRGVKNVFHMPHPMHLRYLDTLKSKKWKSFDELQQCCRLLLLPGSRKFEIKNLLPLFLEASKQLLKQGKMIKVGILEAAHLDSSFYQTLLRNSHIEIEIFKEGGEAFAWADLCLACSGTVTLSTALFEIPSIVCYKTSLLNQFVYETFISYEGPISLANIMKSNSIDKSCPKIFPELIQDQVSLYNIMTELLKLIEDQNHYENVRSQLQGFAGNMQGGQMSVESYFSQLIGQK